MAVAIVTDSTGYLPEGLAPAGLTVVPLSVVVDGQAFDEGVGISPAGVAEALRRRTSVTTSRVPPARFAAAYERLAVAGADEVVSIHLSGDMSGTVDAAELAARDAPIPVTVVDSRTVALALGFAVISACEAAASGAAAGDVAAAARHRADASSTLIVVDSLEQLRRGGRIGSAAALLGTALMVKPILDIRDGVVSLREKQRTSARAVARMVELVRGLAGSAPADIAVQHCAAADRAGDVAGQLRAALPTGTVHLVEVGAVISAHVGLGTVSVAVCPR